MFDTPYGLALTGYYFERNYTEYNEADWPSNVRRSAAESLLERVETFRTEGVDLFSVSRSPPAITGTRAAHGWLPHRRRAIAATLRPTQGSVVDRNFEGRC